MIAAVSTGASIKAQTAEDYGAWIADWSDRAAYWLEHGSYERAAYCAEQAEKLKHQRAVVQAKQAGAGERVGGHSLDSGFRAAMAYACAWTVQQLARAQLAFADGDVEAGSQYLSDAIGFMPEIYCILQSERVQS